MTPAMDSFLAFQNAMEVAKCHVMTPSGGYGAFDLRPQRLVELGYAKNLRRAKNGKRDVWRCDFTGVWTVRKFLGSPLGQVAAFHASLRDYLSQIERVQIKIPPDCSLAGALAILQVGRKGALAAFPDLFSLTQARYDAVKDLIIEVDEDMFQIAALAFLARQCKAGNERACDEWRLLSKTAHQPKMSAAAELARRVS